MLCTGSGPLARGKQFSGDPHKMETASLGWPYLQTRNTDSAKQPAKGRTQALGWARSDEWPSIRDFLPARRANG